MARNNFSFVPANSYEGSFSSVTLPVLSSGLAWDTSNLANNGSIVVIAVAGPPLIATQPKSLTVAPGSMASFSVTAAGANPLSYEWQKNGTNLAGAVTASYSIAAAQTNDEGGYRVIVSNAYGSVTSVVAVLSVTPAGPIT